MSRGRTDVLRVNLPAQQDTSHRDTVDAQRMYLLMLAREKAQQTSSSHNHCPCAKCQVNKGFLFYTSKYIPLHYNYTPSSPKINLLLLLRDEMQFNCGTKFRIWHKAVVAEIHNYGGYAGVLTWRT